MTLEPDFTTTAIFAAILSMFTAISALGMASISRRQLRQKRDRELQEQLLSMTELRLSRELNEDSIREATTIAVQLLGVLDALESSYNAADSDGDKFEFTKARALVQAQIMALNRANSTRAGMDDLSVLHNEWQERNRSRFTDLSSLSDPEEGHD